MQNPIINKVAHSGIVEINLEDFFPAGERVLFDIKENLFQGLALREKEFREFVKNNDWSKFRNKHVAITCSTDAIVPTWAYMLLASSIEPHARKIIFGDLKNLEIQLWLDALSKLNLENYFGARVVVKGCSEKNPVPEAAFVEITRLLKPVVKSLMFGEPCSTVPVFKRKD